MATLKAKYEIIKKLEKGKSQSKLAKELNIPRTTINGYVKRKAEIIEAYENGIQSSTKRFKTHNFDKVDEPLLKFFQMIRDKKIPISGDMLLEKAKTYAKELNYAEFDSLDLNWINRWKKRYSIVGKKNYGEAADDWLKNRLPTLLEEFPKENILNCDETALFYR